MPLGNPTSAFAAGSPSPAVLRSPFPATVDHTLVDASNAMILRVGDVDIAVP